MEVDVSYLQLSLKNYDQWDIMTPFACGPCLGYIDAEILSFQLSSYTHSNPLLPVLLLKLLSL